MKKCVKVVGIGIAILPMLFLLYVTNWYYNEREYGLSWADALDCASVYVFRDNCPFLFWDYPVKYYRKAAEQGHAGAQYRYGEELRMKFIFPDYDGAAKWYRKSANQGYAKAQYTLGLLYLEGKGVPQDKAEAIKWFRKAAKQGHAEAKEELKKLEK